VFATRVEEMRGWELPGELEGLCGAKGVERGMGPDDGIWVGRRDEDKRDEVDVML
jgi:hypothetical protein